MESRISEQERKIDNLHSSLACAQIDVVDRYKASLKYIKGMNEYEAKTMVTSIALTIEWVATEHPSIDPFNWNRFLLQCRERKKRAK